MTYCWRTPVLVLNGPVECSKKYRLSGNKIVKAIEETSLTLAKRNGSFFLLTYYINLSIRPIRSQLPEFQAARRESSPIPAVVRYLPVTLTAQFLAVCSRSKVVAMSPESIAETAVFAGDEPCWGEAICYATARFNALQSTIN